MTRRRTPTRRSSASWATSRKRASSSSRSARSSPTTTCSTCELKRHPDASPGLPDQIALLPGPAVQEHELLRNDRERADLEAGAARGQIDDAAGNDRLLRIDDDGAEFGHQPGGADAGKSAVLAH